MTGDDSQRGFSDSRGRPLTRREIRERLRQQENLSADGPDTAGTPSTQVTSADQHRDTGVKVNQVFDIEAFDDAPTSGNGTAPESPAQTSPAQSSPAPTSPAARALLRPPVVTHRSRRDSERWPGTSGQELVEDEIGRIPPVPASSHAQNYFDRIERPAEKRPERRLSDALSTAATAQQALLERAAEEATVEADTQAAPVRQTPVSAVVNTQSHNSDSMHSLPEAETEAADHPLTGEVEYTQEDDGDVVTAFQPVTTKPAHKRRVRGWVSVALAVVLVGGGGYAGYAALAPVFGWNKIKDFSGPGTGQVVLDVQEGANVRDVATQLEKLGVVADQGTFTSAFTAAGITLSPGSYTFAKQMSASEAVAVLGKQGAKVAYVALSAGLRINDSLAAIAKGTGVKLEDLTALSNQPAQFGLPPQAKNLEGYLFPGEYRFPEGTSAKDILAQLVKGARDELVSQGITDPADQYTKLTIASIVQAEAGKGDYPTVAGAIMNRLKPNDETVGFIQSDATVTYGLGRKSYELTDAEKKDTNNPYNTYAHKGLPVGPIGSPGKLAIDAAAKPKASDYLYWVTINLDTGETLFASTLAQHNANVEKYQQWCSVNTGRCQ